jgi:PAS domain S-box-containing protein
VWAPKELEAFFAIALDLFCFLGFDGRFRRLNPAWERTLGFTREELMSRPFIEFVHPDDRERTLAQNTRVRTGEQALGFENRYLCKDGSYRWLFWNATPDLGDGNIYGVARDITARKQAEQERARLMQQLTDTLAEVKTLQGILPICAYCRKIRDDGDYWHSVEDYIATHTNSRFSHGICPDCFGDVEREINELDPPP